MDDQQIMTIVTSVARSVLGMCGDVVLTEGSDLSDLVYIDSVRLMAFVVEIESAFGIEFPLDELSGDAVTSVGRLTALVRQQLPVAG